MEKLKIIDEKEIPTIPLYIDQVTSYLDEVLEDYKRNESDKILSKTMINNYVKAKVLEGPIKKKYTKDQIMKLIMIYKLKNVIQLNEISEIFSKSDLSTSELYSMFSKIEGKVNSNTMSDNNELNKIEKIIELLLSANAQKKLAEELIDNLIENNK